MDDVASTSASHEHVEQLDQNRRRSARVTRPPAHLSSPAASDRKRKRPSEDVPALVSDNDQELTPAPSDEDLPDAPRRKSQRANAPPNRSQHSLLNGSLPVRTAPPKSNKNNRGKKRQSTSDVDIYTRVFNSQMSADDAVLSWLQDFDKDQTNALMELINCLLRCSGCELQVDRYEVEDPDNAANKVGDLQELYQAQNVTNYPLVAKGSSGSSFRKTLTSFFATLVTKLAETDILYDDPKVLENIWVWMGSMSSSSNRPFRHTATVTSLSMISALCEVANDLIETRAKFLRQVEGESKKKKVNQNRVKDLQTRGKQAAEQLVQLNSIVNDWFDALFLQRYRDTMPTLRVDCALHLTDWIMTHPEQFFDGSHLRYLGWTLADQDRTVRLTVLKQLQTIYKDESKTTGLHHFTERFRPRMVEMATRDVDTSIRVAAVELLAVLRDAGLVEPDDVDTVGKLIYDSESQIRKAVAPFLVASVEEIFNAYVDDLGGEEAVHEGLPVPNEADSETLRSEWLRFKGLAELLVSFDPSRNAEQEPNPTKDNLTAFPTNVESRVCLAAEAIYHLFPHLSSWQQLAGYLLTDHSQSSNSSSADNFGSRFRRTCGLSDREEIVLLDVLYTAVKASLDTETNDHKDKKHRKTTKELQLRKENHEQAIQQLAILIPRLLNKFSAMPEAATAVLRLENLLDLDALQDARQDNTTLESMLEDIKKQFMSHESASVLSQAAAVLHHAKTSDEADDIVSEKLQSIWDDTTHALLAYCTDRTMNVRGTLSLSNLESISTTTLRISVLSRLFNCIDPLETPKKYAAPKAQRRQHKDSQQACLDLLVQLLGHGRPLPGIAHEMAIAEDGMVLNVMQCILAYFLWHAHALQSAQPAAQAYSENSLLALIDRRRSISTHLHAIISELHGADSLRVAAARLLLDLHIMFVNRSGDAGSETMRQLADEEIDKNWQADLIKVFVALETAFAKKSNRKLESPGDDEEPENLSDEEDASSTDEAENSQEADEEAIQRKEARAAKKKKDELVAEHTLCDFTGKMIRALIAGVLDRVVGQTSAGIDSTPTASARRRAAGEPDGPVRQRLTKNRARLGPNFKALMDLLDRDGLPAVTAQRGIKSDAVVKALGKKTDGSAKGKNGKQLSNAEVGEGDEDVDGDDTMDDENPDPDDLVGDEIVVEDDEDHAEARLNGGEGADDNASEVESLLGD